LNADEVIKIIEKLPEYIKLIYPGYITVYLYYFFKAFTLKDNKAIILKAIILSYIYNIVTSELCDVFYINGILGYEFVENILLIIFSVTVAYFSYRLTTCKLLRNMLDRLNIRTTFSSNEIEEMESQSSDGTWLVVYLKESNIVYEGYIVNKEMEPEKERYIALSRYRKYTVDANGKPVTPYIDDCANNCKEKVVIYYNQISRFEIRDTSCKNKPDIE
jgi:hypothetical protein